MTPCSRARRRQSHPHNQDLEQGRGSPHIGAEVHFHDVRGHLQEKADDPHDPAGNVPAVHGGVGSVAVDKDHRKRHHPDPDLRGAEASV